MGREEREGGGGLNQVFAQLPPDIYETTPNTVDVFHDLFLLSKLPQRPRQLDRPVAVSPNHPTAEEPTVQWRAKERVGL